MNLQKLSEQLTMLYNTLGNKWLVQTFETEPFEFSVSMRKGGDDDHRDYEIDVNTDRKFPDSLKYRENKKTKFDGVHRTVIERHFKEMFKYVDTSFGGFRKTIGVNLINREE